MFLYVYVMGWIHRALWRMRITTNCTAPSFKTAWLVYGIRPKPRVWVDEWVETGCDCAWNHERIPFRSHVAHCLRKVGV